MNPIRPLIAVTLTAGLIYQAAGAEPLFDENAGCMEGPMAQFGRYIGDWIIEDSQLQPDGVTWQPGAGAEWHFKCLGNGVAIQDFWLPNSGGFGSNLRTYHPETESWDIAWTARTLPGFAHIGATMEESGNIVMMYKSPIPDPLRRITFFPPTDEGWNWTLEFSNDGGENWLEVYRIKAIPKGSSD